MLHGLLWLPLLVVFIGLAWAGWNEYQKVEGYRQWATGFEQAKYDIYAVLGYKDSELAWGKPTRQGILDLQTFSLQQVQQIRLLVNDAPIAFDTPHPPQGAIALEFGFPPGQTPIKIPFTEFSLAAQWGQFLQEKLSRTSTL